MQFQAPAPWTGEKDSMRATNWKLESSLLHLVQWLDHRIQDPLDLVYQQLVQQCFQLEHWLGHQEQVHQLVHSELEHWLAPLEQVHRMVYQEQVQELVHQEQVQELVHQEQVQELVHQELEHWLEHQE